MQNQEAYDSEYKKWQSWFGKGSDLQTQFSKWMRLRETCQGLQRVLAKANFSSQSARNALERAKQKLNYKAPYRLIVVGETGAGKSTLINAIVGRNLLGTGSGGAITGAATFVHLGRPESKNNVLVVYRTEEEFLSLLRQMLTRAGLPAPESVEEVQAEYGSLVEKSGLADAAKAQLSGDMNDIVEAWSRLKAAGRLGARDPYNIEHDREKLKEIMEERSSRNAPKSATRDIAGIARVEYYVSDPQVKGMSANWLPHAVLIDTPGLGARTLRHREILQEQVEKAEAVILVIGAGRPEGQTTSLTQLLRETLFNGYTPEERSRFVSKVFLVVNKIDDIKNEDDRARLRESIEEISSVIAHGYLSRYGAASRDKRYFEIDASIVAGADGHGSYSDKGGENTGPLPELIFNLREFLSKRRLELMLDEAEAHLRRAVSHARSDSEEVLKKNGVEVSDSVEPKVTQSRHRQQLCSTQLCADYEELQAAYDEVHAEMDGWRRSPQYERALLEVYMKIDNELEGVLRSHLHRLRQNGRGITSTVIDDITGKVYVEAHVRALLLTIEREMRNAVEAATRQLGQYYLAQFDDQLNKHGLLELVRGKSYGQGYIIRNLDPVMKLEETLEQIQQAFAAACCWVVLYELIQRPILVSDANQGSKVWGVAETISPVEAKFARVAHFAEIFERGNRAADAAKEGSDPDYDHEPAKRSEGRVRIVPPQPGPGHRADVAEPITSQEQLIDTIERVIGNKDISEDQIQDLIVAPFIKRYQAAFGIALPKLENLFFYQIGKFRLTFGHVIEELLSEHLAQIRSNPGAEIIDLLMEHQQGAKSEIDKAIQILEFISQNFDARKRTEAA
ncbi:MAG: dynamin family protein [Blastocatellia bacterium]